MSGGGYDTSQGLFGYGPKIGHRQIILCQLDIKIVEGNSSLSDDISFLNVDLHGNKRIKQVSICSAHYSRKNYL